MKTAVSLPDVLFREAERLARRLRKSRSRLYREAVAEYVARHDPDAVTAKLDELADELGTSDAFVGAAGRRTLERQRLVVAQGDVCWANLPRPSGSGPGFRRPVLVAQREPFNRSRIATVVRVPLTSNLRLAEAPGNVLLPAESTGLPKDSVANVSQVVTLDRAVLSRRVGHVPTRLLDLVLTGIDLVLGRA